MRLIPLFFMVLFFSCAHTFEVYKDMADVAVVNYQNVFGYDTCWVVKGHGDFVKVKCK